VSPHGQVGSVESDDAHSGVGLATARDAGDPPEQLYTPWATWIRAKRGRGVAVAAAVLIAAQALIRGWFSFRGWFVGDDYAFMARAATMRPFSWDYLMQSYGGHVMPGAFLYVWLLQHWAPMNYTPVVLGSIVMQALTAALLYRLLRNLFGTRPALLIPLTIYLFSPITLPAFLWWAAGLNQLPQQLAIVSALLLHVRYLRTGRRRAGLAGVLCVVGGLLFSEKTVLAVPLILALTVLMFTAGPPLRRLRTAFTRHWVVSIAYLAVAGSYAAYYLLEVPSPTRGAATSGGYVQTLGNQVNHALVPGLLGGPWRWREISSNGGLAHPGPLAIGLSAIVILAVIVGTVVLAHRAVFGWLLLAGYVLINAGLLTITRAVIVGPLIGDEYRYLTDVCLVAVICGSLAALPLTGSYLRAEPQRLIRRRWTQSRLETLSQHDVVGTLPKLRAPVVVGGTAAALIISSLVSTSQFDRIWHPNPSRDYLQTAVRELADAPPDLVLYGDAPVPENVAWTLIYPYNAVHYMLAGLGRHPNLMSTTTSATPLYMLDDAGHIRMADVTDQVHNWSGPFRNCGWRISKGPVQVPLRARLFPWTWMIRIGYIASGESTTHITAGNTSLDVPIHHGLHALFLVEQGPIDSIRFSGLSGGTVMCTDEIRVGFPVPIPTTVPQ
jgi:hypothetical protein